MNYSQRNPFASTIKWLDRSSWNAIKAECEVDVLLFLDQHNRYLECCIGNVFVYRPREKQWYTPPLSLPLLPGIMRSVLLSNAAGLGEDILETHITHEQTDEIWMSNALRGLCLLNGTSQPPKWSVVGDGTIVETRALKHFRDALSHF